MLTVDQQDTKRYLKIKKNACPALGLLYGQTWMCVKYYIHQALFAREVKSIVQLIYLEIQYLKEILSLLRVLFSLTQIWWHGAEDNSWQDFWFNMLLEWSVSDCSASSCDCLQLQPYLPPEPTSRQAQGTKGELLNFVPFDTENSLKAIFNVSRKYHLLQRWLLCVYITCQARVPDVNTVLFLI